MATLKIEHLPTAFDKLAYEQSVSQSETMEYAVAFDVVKSGYRQWTFPAFGLIFVLLSAWSLFIHRKFPTKVHLFFARFGFGFSLFWVTIAFFGTFGEYQSLSSALREGRCEVIEGIVTDFHPMPYSGHQSEWFVVGGERFEYSDYNATAGFNQTASHGGPIHGDERVRLSHVGNKIARLEIAR